MEGEKNLEIILKSLQPKLNTGEYVFCSIQTLNNIDTEDILLFFREQEAITIIIKKEIADRYDLTYSFVAAWITLNVFSALDAVGLTAAFSTALSNELISCNVVAGYYHDHIFVDSKHAAKAMKILQAFSEK